MQYSYTTIGNARSAAVKLDALNRLRADDTTTPPLAQNELFKLEIKTATATLKGTAAR
jgi:hypothetical protein